MNDFLKLYTRVMKARVKDAQKSGLDAIEALDITCDLCNNAAWWSANGFTEEERQAMCGPNGINCKGFEDTEG